MNIASSAAPRGQAPPEVIETLLSLVLVEFSVQ